MFALLKWSSSGKPPSVLAPSMFWATTRSTPSKFPAAFVNAICGVFSRWSWKFPISQWRVTASGLRFAVQE